MKKTLLAIGLLTLISLFNGCIDSGEYVPLDNTDSTEMVVQFIDSIETEIKIFNKPVTRTTVHPSWVKGNKICVYSIDENGTILCSSVCEVYDINKNLGRIEATVAKDCEGYFAAFPSYLFDYKPGDVISMSEDKGMSGTIDISNLHFSGEFGDACAMTSWCDWCEGDGYFKFNARSSVIRFSGIKNSMFPLHFELFEEGVTEPYFQSIRYTNNFPYEEMFFPLSVENKKIHLDIYYHNNATPITFPSGGGFGLAKVGEIISVGGEDIKK